MSHSRVCEGAFLVSFSSVPSGIEVPIGGVCMISKGVYQRERRGRGFVYRATARFLGGRGMID